MNMKNKREISFRLWNTKSIQYTDFFVDSNGYVKIIDHLGNFKTGYDCDPPFGYKLMQFIGIYDKNGEEVYEGDIIKFNSFDDLKIKTGIVTFSDGSFRITVDDYFHAYRWMDYECEVIGNIYENKDQIKKDQI